MKKLIMFLLVYINPNAIFSQSIDTLQPLRQFDVSKWGQPVTSTSLGEMTLQTGSVEWRLPVSKPDTTCEYMHLSVRDVGFVISRVALSVRINGICVKHLQSNGRPFPVHYRVGWCEGKEEFFNRLIRERQCEGIYPNK